MLSERRGCPARIAAELVDLVARRFDERQLAVRLGAGQSGLDNELVCTAYRRHADVPCASIAQQKRYELPCGARDPLSPDRSLYSLQTPPPRLMLWQTLNKNQDVDVI